MSVYLVGVNPEGKKEPIHRIVAERYLERKLKPGETVHHIDENKENNCIINLIVFEDNEAHIRYHDARHLGNNRLPRYKRENYNKETVKDIFYNTYGIVLYGPFYAKQIIQHNKRVLKSQS